MQGWMIGVLVVVLLGLVGLLIFLRSRPQDDD
jgi:hypothetical protein